MFRVEYKQSTRNKRTANQVVLMANDQYNMKIRFGRVMDYVIVRDYKLLENTAFRILDLYPSSCDRREIHTLLGPLERASLSR
jgi:hypothetical protein